MGWLRSPTEQQVLALSIWVTLGIAALGIGFGLASGSQSILFDGVFSIVDAGMAMLALFVSRLLLRRGSRRFHYGYWHFEPMVALFNGSILLAICVYAAVNAATGLLRGGHQVDLGGAVTYAVVVFALCLAMFGYERAANRRLRSELVRIDTSSFLMSACVTLALLLGFLGARALARAGYPELEPYADPLILLLIAAGLVPVPVGIVRRALREIFLVAPESATARVREVMDGMCEKYGFRDFRVYLAKVGRVHTVDIHVLVDDSFARTAGELDGIREEIAARLEGLAHLDEWLSIDFTSRREWI